jgi:hypothetical protein
MQRTSKLFTNISRQPILHIEGGSRNRASLLEEGQSGGSLGRASLLQTPKDMLIKALAWVSVSIVTLLLGNMEGCSFLGALR